MLISLRCLRICFALLPTWSRQSKGEVPGNPEADLCVDFGVDGVNLSIQHTRTHKDSWLSQGHGSGMNANR